MLCDAPGRARFLGEELRGTTVCLCPFGLREFGIDPSPDDRMDELQRPAGLEHPCGRQQLGCLGCLELFEARESPRLEKVALLEHSQRPSEPPGMLGKSTKPEANRPADRSCADSFDVAGGLRSRTDTSFAQRLHEHVQE